MIIVDMAILVVVVVITIMIRRVNDVIDEQVEQRQDAHIGCGALVDGDLSGQAHLDVVAEPDEARIDRAVGLPLARPIQAAFHGELHHRDQLVERMVEADIPDVMLEVVEAPGS